MVFQTILGVISRCWTWYLPSVCSAAMRAWRILPSAEEILMSESLLNGLNSGVGCSGEPGRKRSIMSAMTIVKIPSTVMSQHLRRNIHLSEQVFKYLRKKIHCHPLSPCRPSSLMIPAPRSGLNALPANMPKKNNAILFASSFRVYQVDRV